MSAKCPFGGGGAGGGGGADGGAGGGRSAAATAAAEAEAAELGSRQAWLQGQLGVVACSRLIMFLFVQSEGWLVRGV
jgi:hypothetical protein